MKKQQQPAPAFLQSDSSRSCAAITTEHLALIGFAARLGTCVNNDAEDPAAASSSDEEADHNAKSVRDEAMLLMSLLMGNKASEILSEEIGVKESRCRAANNKRKQCRPKDRDMGNEFSFTFPSLSLQPETTATAAGNSEGADGSETGQSSSQEPQDDGAKPQAAAATAEEDDNLLPPPSLLLSRPKSVRDKDSVRDSSESMAHNVLESFGAALAWRAKIWIKSLADVLALKEQERMSCKNMEVAAGEEGEGESSQSKDDVNENDDDRIMNSREMQIIDAIVKSSEEVSVVNVKTAFRVLPNKVASPTNSSSQDAVSSIEGGHAPAKKARKEESPHNEENVIEEYKVTHKLVFEATVSMTSNDGVRYNGVKLQAPGYIQGTFTNNNNKAAGASRTVEGDETLSGVSMTLDTDALALSLEQQSRLVVRRAAEAALIAASGGDCASSQHYMESPRVHHSVISPRYVLMSPVPPSYRSSAYVESSVVNTAAPLPSVPSVNALNGNEETADPSSSSGTTSGVVSSSSEGHSSSSSFSDSHASDSSAGSALPLLNLKASDSSTGSALPSLKLKASGTGGGRTTQSPSFPALLSVASEELTRGD